MSSQYLRQAFLFSQNRWLNLSEEETSALCWYNKLCSDKLIYLDRKRWHVWTKPKTAFKKTKLTLTVKHGGVIFRNLTSSQHRSYHDVFSLRVLEQPLESQSPTGLLQHDNDPKVPVNPLTADWNLRNRGSRDRNQTIKPQILIPLSWWGCWK